MKPEETFHQAEEAREKTLPQCVPVAAVEREHLAAISLPDSFMKVDRRALIPVIMTVLLIILLLETERILELTK